MFCIKSDKQLYFSCKNVSEIQKLVVAECCILRNIDGQIVLCSSTSINILCEILWFHRVLFHFFLFTIFGYLFKNRFMKYLKYIFDRIWFSISQVISYLKKKQMSFLGWSSSWKRSSKRSITTIWECINKWSIWWNSNFCIFSINFVIFNIFI